MAEVITDLKLYDYWWLKITKGNNCKIMQGRLSFLCAAPLLSKIYPPMKFQVDTSNTLRLAPDKIVWKRTKGNNSKIIYTEELSFLGTAFLLNKIYPPMTFHVDISNTFALCSTKVKNYVWKITKGNNSKIMKGRVIILVHCTPPEWDLCTYEVSCWYLKGLLSYALDKN
jgi:hypothetical protein